MMQILNGAIGDLNRGHMLQAHFSKEFGAQENRIFGSNIGHNQISNVGTEFLSTRIEATAGGDQIAVDVAFTYTMTWTGHIVAENNILISILIIVILIIVFIVVVVVFGGFLGLLLLFGSCLTENK